MMILTQNFQATKGFILNTINTIFASQILHLDNKMTVRCHVKFTVISSDYATD